MTSVAPTSRVVPPELIELADRRAATYGGRYAVGGGVEAQGCPFTFHVTPYANLNGRRPLYLTKE